MVETRSDQAFRALIIRVAAFSYATGFYISTKKFLDFAPTDPIAVGRVTVEGASKLQDYVRFGYLLLIVPALTLLLIHWLPRVGRRVTRSAPPEKTPLSLLAFAAVPLVLAPFLYLTTYKELWSVLLPPLLSWLILGGWVLTTRFDWLRTLLASGRNEVHALIGIEGISLLLCRYIATGSRIAHVPSFLLETIFIALFLALWWSAVASAARFSSLRTKIDIVETWSRIAIGASPLFLLPLFAILPLKFLPVLAIGLTVGAAGDLMMLRARSLTVTQRGIERFAAWIAAPTVIFVLSYASSAHTTAWIDLFHAGENLGPASDYLRGKIPYLGVFPIHGLLQDGLLDAWLMSWLGRSADIAILRETFLEALMLPAIWILAWNVFRSWTASTGSILFAIVLAADNQRAVLEILVVLLLTMSIRSGKRWLVLAAGALSSISLFFSLEIGIYCLFGAILGFVAVAILEPSRASLRVCARTSAIYLAGVVVGALPFLLYLGFSGALGAFFSTTFVTIPRVIDPTWSLPFPDLDDWFSKSFPQESLYQVAWHIRFAVNGLVLTLAIIVLCGRALKRSITMDDRLLAVLTAFALVTQRSALGRADFYHQWFAAFLISPILVALVWRAIRIDQRQPAGVKTAVLMTTVGLIPVVLALFWIPPLLEGRLDDAIEFRARRAGVAPDPDGQGSARRIERVVSEIRIRTGEDDPIFDFSNQPAFYFFADRRNPTRFYQVPLISPLAFQREVIRDLERDPPAVVLMSSPDNFDRFDAITSRDRALLVSSWIEHHYTPSTRVEGVELWTPSADEPAPWSPPSPVPGPREIALRPNADGRVVFPSVGTVAGADRARWSSDLYLYNPHSVPVGFRLRFVTRDEIREHRYSVQPGESARLESIAETFFGMPQRLGALWVIYDQTFPPRARIVTRRDPGSSRGIHAEPLGRGDLADTDEDRSSLLINGFIVRDSERANLSIVNFGFGPAEAIVRMTDAKGDPAGRPYTTRIGEEHSFVIVDLLGQLGTEMPHAGSIRIDVLAGRVAAQLSIVDTETGSADVLNAVPIKGDDPD